MKVDGPARSQIWTKDNLSMTLPTGGGPVQWYKPWRRGEEVICASPPRVEGEVESVVHGAYVKRAQPWPSWQIGGGVSSATSDELDAIFPSSWGREQREGHVLDRDGAMALYRCRSRVAARQSFVHGREMHVDSKHRCLYPDRLSCWKLTAEPIAVPFL